MHTSSTGTQSKFTALALAFTVATLWLALRGYHGLTGDAQIYAFQALARLRPQLATDLYLQNTSQDQFTAFSPFYAACIDLLGLENAARLLTMLFTVWLLAAAWSAAPPLPGPCPAGAWRYFREKEMELVTTPPEAPIRSSVALVTLLCGFFSQCLRMKSSSAVASGGTIGFGASSS